MENKKEGMVLIVAKGISYDWRKDIKAISPKSIKIQNFQSI
jgi:hypothetical protein